MTFGAIVDDSDMISKTRARLTVRNQLSYNFIRGLYMLGPIMRASSGFPKCQKPHRVNRPTPLWL